MNKLVVNLLVLQHTITGKLEQRREAGQGTLEYIAMIALAGVLILALSTVFTGVGKELADKVKTVIDSVLNIK